ncbi:4Fe-4S binding protein [Claveliimonas bilis]|uniref:4Fe-4S binding protein n=1 Tax=Claveliimonas bilis TaxID=3028070 RepID=UPI003A7F36F2
MEQQDKGENAKAFLVNSACIRCGICVKVCPANNITLEKQIKFHDKWNICAGKILAMCLQEAI